jgi:hypothetical protein
MREAVTVDRKHSIPFALVGALVMLSSLSLTEANGEIQDLYEAIDVAAWRHSCDKIKV